MRSDEIPELPGYMTVATVARIFGIEKESVFYKIYEQGAFQHVYKVGPPEETRRPVLLLLESEVRRVFSTERASVPMHTSRTLLKEWNKRVKAWGRETGWTETPIADAGRPPKALVQAYLEANPEDTRPE